MTNHFTVAPERTPHGIYPDLETLLGGTDKARLMQVRRSLRSIISGFVLMLLSSIAVYVVNYYYAEISLPLEISFLPSLSTRWLAVIPLGILLEIIRRYNDDLYVLGEENIMHYEGRLSLSYSVPAVKYAHVRAITVHQDIMGRIFDYGDVALGTAAQDENELVLEGVRSPVQLGRLIEDLLHYNRVKMRAESPRGEQRMTANLE